MCVFSGDLVDTVLLDFSKIEDFYCSNFVYKSVSDDNITMALKDERLDRVDPNIEWEDDLYLRNEWEIDDDSKHADRVASIVRSIREEGFKGSLCLDTMGYHYVCALPDGHHRVRALQYLGYGYAPFNISGYVDDNEKLENKAIHVI